jgi:hypothetical protein
VGWIRGSNSTRGSNKGSNNKKSDSGIRKISKGICRHNYGRRRGYIKSSGYISEYI